MIERLLVIDDDELTLYLVSKLVKSEALANQIITKENGHEAINYLQNVDESGDDFPEVIMVDIDMPVMDGYGFIEAYQKRFWKKFLETKVMMVTSSKRKSDFEKSQIYKCISKYYHKPITKEMLVNITKEVT